MKKLTLLIACIAVATSLQAGQKMTESIKAEIKKAAEIEYPNDFSMQAYKIKTETAAFEQFQAMEKPSSMSSSTFELIKTRAQRKWPKDYGMQLYDLKDQLKGWLAVNGK